MFLFILDLENKLKIKLNIMNSTYNKRILVSKSKFIYLKVFLILLSIDTENFTKLLKHNYVVMYAIKFCGQNDILILKA